MKTESLSRRAFLAASVAAGAAAILPFRSEAFRAGGPTVQDVIDVLLKEVSGAPFAQTVDTIKAGSASQPVQGIVTTMFPTMSVIRKTLELKANFIIAHEPTFYNHLDEVKWLGEHEVYRKKRELIDSSGIVIWRMHDYIHSFRPDGIRMGLIQAMGWEKYDQVGKKVLNIEPISVKQIIALAKKKLGITNVKVIGDLKQEVRTVGLLPGAIGGTAQMQFMQAESPDLLIVGEVHEWETAEYFRDLNASGQKKTLLILGHSVSEEPGMKWLAAWLKEKFPALATTHVPSGDPFLWE